VTVRQAPRRRVVFLTGTRADFGKMKPLMKRLDADPGFDVHVFVTGMHMLSKYGYTCAEVELAGFKRLYKFVNQNADDAMDHILSKTIVGLSDYLREISPDLVVIHGDRVEALAGAAVGALNNRLTAHVEGGEVSGTIDEVIRHAVTKMSHVHFVANELARQRLVQLGEPEGKIHVIGSPDIDVMNSPELPTLEAVRAHYEIAFPEYGILMFHPVTTEFADMPRQAREVVDGVIDSGLNYVVVYPNNDPGSAAILDAYRRLLDNPRFRVFPSMRFEYFLTLLRHAKVVVGNSSAGIREAPHYGVPTVNLGTRQQNRATGPGIVDERIERSLIAGAIGRATQLRPAPEQRFGDGTSGERFHRILREPAFWTGSTQKYFVDRVFAG